MFSLALYKKAIAFAVVFFFGFYTSVYADTLSELDYQLSLSSQQFGYSGAMAVFQLANDWHGDLKSGEDAIFYQDNRIDFSVDKIADHFGLKYSLLSIQYHEYHFTNDLARGFYFYNNEYKLDQRYQINTYLKANMYSGTGHEFGFSYQNGFDNVSNLQINIAPSYRITNIDKIIWGQLEGDLYYRSQKHWGGTIDLNYGYTKDHVGRRKLQKSYQGTMQAFNLDFTISYDHGQFSYQGKNLWNNISFPDMPRTSAEVSTEKEFFIYGFEFNKDYDLTANKLYHISLNHKLPKLYYSHFHALMTWQHTAVEDFIALGTSYRNHDFIIDMTYDYQHRAIEVSLNSKHLDFSFASQTFDISKSQVVKLALALKLPF